VQWLRAEMLKTRVAHGYCARSLVAEACSYANICEQLPQLALLTPVRWSPGTKLGMLALRGYLVIGAVLLLVQAIQLGGG
jgi:hypothetical protein